MKINVLGSDIDISSLEKAKDTIELWESIKLVSNDFIKNFKEDKNDFLIRLINLKLEDPGLEKFKKNPIYEEYDTFRESMVFIRNLIENTKNPLNLNYINFAEFYKCISIFYDAIDTFKIINKEYLVACGHRLLKNYTKERNTKERNTDGYYI